MFHFFYTRQLWGHKEKTVAASGTGRKKNRQLSIVLTPRDFLSSRWSNPCFCQSCTLSWHQFYPFLWQRIPYCPDIYSTPLRSCCGQTLWPSSPQNVRVLVPLEPVQGHHFKPHFFYKSQVWGQKGKKKTMFKKPIALLPLSWHLK